MTEDIGLPTVVNDAQRNLILMQTPPAEIFQRKGRGGKTFDYVKVGYVVEQLNLAFGFNWDFEVIDQKYNDESDEIVVLGKLTVRAGGHTITKFQFGGTAVKRTKKTDEIISFADDCKAAAADALKKCASLVGIAHDVYRGKANNKVGGRPRHWIDDATVRKRFWAWAKGTLGLTEDEVHEALQVESVKAFEGTMKAAKATLEAFAIDGEGA